MKSENKAAKIFAKKVSNIRDDSVMGTIDDAQMTPGTPVQASVTPANKNKKKQAKKDAAAHKPAKSKAAETSAEPKPNQAKDPNKPVPGKTNGEPASVTKPPQASKPAVDAPDKNIPDAPVPAADTIPDANGSGGPMSEETAASRVFKSGAPKDTGVSASSESSTPSETTVTQPAVFTASAAEPASTPAASAEQAPHHTPTEAPEAAQADEAVGLEEEKAASDPAVHQQPTANEDSVGFEIPSDADTHNVGDEDGENTAGAEAHRAGYAVSTPQNPAVPEMLNERQSTTTPEALRGSQPLASPAARWLMILFGLLLLAGAVVCGRELFIIYGGYGWGSWIQPVTTYFGEMTFKNWMVPAAVLSIIVGLLLLWLALRPRTKTHRQLDSEVSLWTRPVDIARMVTAKAEAQPGVLQARTVADKKTIKLTVVGDAFDPTLQPRVEEAVSPLIAMVASQPSLKIDIDNKEA